MCLRLWTEISSPRDSAVDPTATLEEDTVDPNDQAATGAPKARQDPTWVKRPASLDGFLADLRPTGGPSVHFLHILLPHQPWRYLPSGLKYRERPVGEGLMKEGRWSTERSGQWMPLKPRLVVEVSYDHFTGERFRHGTRLIRWRPDKAAEQCTMDQVKQRQADLMRLLK